MPGVSFWLNGELRTEDRASPSTTVLDWLRNAARLTGTKEGCAEGDCGACTIVVGRPYEGALRFEAVNSCLMMLPQLDGGFVLTIEGLAAADGALHPVQRALVETHATQCGFCTPGFAMAMFAFHHGGEGADDNRIHEALAVNLCRCTGYRSIVDACRRVAHGPQDRFADEAAALAERAGGLAPGAEYRAGEQSFLAPRTLDELLAATEKHPDAILLGGGTDLGLRVAKDREQLPLVISTAGIEELRRVAIDGDGLVIGGPVTYTQALADLDAHFPSFGMLVRRIGSRQIRNLGTFAGNLATASPIGDTLPCLIALDATVALASRSGTRTMPVEQFITGYRKTALAPGEIILAIRIPFLAPASKFAAYKVAKRFDQDISTLVVAFRLALEDGRVRELRAAFGGMAARPLRAKSLENAMAGRPWTEAALADVEALLLQDFAPISDHRGGAVYRMRAAAGLLQRFRLETNNATLVRVEAL